MVERHAGGLSLQLMFDRNLHGMPEAALRLDMLAETLSAMPDSADIAVAAIDALPAILLNPLLDKASTAASISAPAQRSEEHTSELQSLMRISYAVFCLKKKNTNMYPTE